MRLDIRNSGGEDRRPGSTWLILGEGTIAAVIGLTNSEIHQLVADPVAAIADCLIVSVAERIRWWNLSIEHGVNYVCPDGQWSTMNMEYLKGPNVQVRESPNGRRLCTSCFRARNTDLDRGSPRIRPIVVYVLVCHKRESPQAERRAGHHKRPERRVERNAASEPRR